MIEYKHGDILRDDAEAVVNTVNCVGVMGRGIALQFKKAWPENFKAYATACKNEDVQPGKCWYLIPGSSPIPATSLTSPPNATGAVPAE